VIEATMNMHPTFTSEIATERTRDLLREADRYRLASAAASARTVEPTMATEFDSVVVERRFVRRRRWFVRNRVLGHDHSLPL
jgi:hypothetical protein